MVWTPPSHNRHQRAIVVFSHQLNKGGDIMKEINVIGLDLAKNIFQVMESIEKVNVQPTVNLVESKC
jgi:hypothetical protein